MTSDSAPDDDLTVLFIANNFPPEVNALAHRMYEHGREWASQGGGVVVMTDVPNYPEGEVYDGYENTFDRSVVDGMTVYRVPMYVAENKGVVRRTLSHMSFMVSIVWHSRQVREDVDVVAASTPQFFSSLAGWLVSRMRRVPYVLEVRDLWPDAIPAVGAIHQRWILAPLEWIERCVYRAARHVVVVTHSFKDAIASKGIPERKITVLPNGVDLQRFEGPWEESILDWLRQRLQPAGRFVVAYIGTIGMAHRVEVMVEAARRYEDEDVLFLVVGAGAERDRIEAMARELGSSNFQLLEKQPSEYVPYLLALADVSVVHLRDTPLFRTVLPSKMFEAMAMGVPIAMGVRGEARELMERAGAGLAFPPEDAEGLLRVVDELRDDPELCRRMSESGRRFVREHFDRRDLARTYWRLLKRVAADRPAGEHDGTGPAGG